MCNDKLLFEFCILCYVMHRFILLIVRFNIFVSLHTFKFVYFKCNCFGKITHQLPEVLCQVIDRTRNDFGSNLLARAICLRQQHIRQESLLHTGRSRWGGLGEMFAVSEYTQGELRELHPPTPIARNVRFMWSS